MQLMTRVFSFENGKVETARQNNNWFSLVSCYASWNKENSLSQDLLNRIFLDCEQSIFSSKIREEGRKTSKCASATTSVTYERSATVLHLSLRSSPRIFSQKEECAQSRISSSRFLRPHASQTQLQMSLICTV